MEPAKVKCVVEGCDHLILPQTAARTGGRCMRCVQKEEETKRQDYIRTHRRRIDPYAGLSEPLDIIQAYHTPRERSVLIDYAPLPLPLEGLYARLTEAQAQVLIRQTVESKEDDIAEYLARFTEHNLSALQAAWARAHHFTRPVVFRGASALARDQIIAFLEAADDQRGRVNSVNQALCALAWIGDDASLKAMERWRRHPPAWRASLYVEPTEYPHEAGWEIRDGRRRDLFHRECWAIQSATANAPTDLSIEVFNPTGDPCPWCGESLVTMLQLDLADARLSFVKCEAAKLSVLTCANCTCYGSGIFSRFDQMGRASWHEKNLKPEYLSENKVVALESPWRGHACHLVPRLTTAGAGDDGVTELSQIGGLPGWVQDSGYPQCPDCNETMTFIAKSTTVTSRATKGFTMLSCAPTAA